MGRITPALGQSKCLNRAPSPTNLLEPVRDSPVTPRRLRVAADCLQKGNWPETGIEEIIGSQNCFSNQTQELDLGIP